MRAMRESKDVERRCIVTGEIVPKEELLRFVVGPADEIVPDLDESLPGRGLWLKAGRDMIAKACSSGAFARAAHRGVHPPEDLVGQVERLLRRRCLSLIGLARRAGAVAIGFDGVRTFLAAQRPGLLIEARDGAADGRQKLRAMAPDAPLVDLFDAAELGEAMGREHLVHAAIEKGRMAERIWRETRRLNAIS